MRYLGDNIVASVDDSGKLCAFRLTGDSSPVTASVCYQHPTTVWSLAAINPSSAGDYGNARNVAPASGAVADVATGCADHVVRVFTASEERALRGDALQEAENASQHGAGVGGDCRCVSSTSSPGLEGGHTLPSVSDMPIMVGQRDGQLSAFADNNGRAQV